MNRMHFVVILHDKYFNVPFYQYIVMHHLVLHHSATEIFQRITEFDCIYWSKSATLD